MHHSDRGAQYTAIRYTDRLEEIGAMRSVGSRGDSYDNALAETVNGLYKAEVIHRQRSWRSLESGRRDKAAATLRRIAEQSELSADVRDIVTRSLA